MLIKNVPLIILTSIITLLPALTGSIMPLILLFAHLFCIFITSKDKKNENQNQKVFRMIFWICPLMSLFTAGVNYAILSGMEFGVEVFTMAMIGLIFAVIGNYLPKCKQNYTIGIKVPWVYTSEENWNKPHRLGGKIWVAGGLLILFSIFFPENIREIVMVAGFIAMILIPVVYSYLFYRKEKAEGLVVSPGVLFGKSGKLSAVFFVAILIFVGIMMFTGNIEVICQDDAVTIDADYWDNMTVKYENIEHIEYREEGVSGSRSSGFGSARLLMGTFHNEELGYYTRYTYTQCDSAVVLTLKNSELVISGKDEEATKALYDELLEKVDDIGPEDF